MTEVLFAVIDAGAISEEDLEEPVEIGMDLDLALIPTIEAGGEVPTDGGVEAGGVVPTYGGVPPMLVATEFGTRTQFRLGRLSIIHNLGNRGWWFAVKVEELVKDDVRVTGLDAHITLFYLRSDQDQGELIAVAMSECLQQIVGRRGSLPIDFNAAGGMSPYSTEHLAMIELLVACPAHQAVRTTYVRSSGCRSKS